MQLTKVGHGGITGHSAASCYRQGRSDIATA